MEFLDSSWFRTRIESESALYREILDYFNSSPELVEAAVHEYAEFFRNPTAGGVPRHVAYIWRVHMLHPMHYRADCRKAFGKLVVPFYNDRDFIPQLKMDYVRQSGEEARFPSIDLAAGMRRQFKFMRKMKHLSLGAEYIDAAVERFQMWISLIAKTKGPLVPTLDIDLVWHALMLSPGKYKEITVAELGYMMNHDDNVKDNVLKKEAHATEELWLRTYEKPFYIAARNDANCDSAGGPCHFNCMSKCHWHCMAQCHHDAADVAQKVVLCGDGADCDSDCQWTCAPTRSRPM